MLRLYVGSDLFLHEWDERYHALVAKNYIKHPLKPTLYDNPVIEYSYRDWTSNHIWVHKPPLALWLMAISMKIFGVNEIALRLPSILLSTIAIYFTYGIGKFLFDRKVAIFAAGFHSINIYLIKLASGLKPTDHVDTLMIVLITLGIWLSILQLKQANNLLLPAIGICTGFALLTKWLPAMLIPAVWLAYAFSQKEPRKAFKLLVILLTAACVATPWQVYICNAFPQEFAWENSYNLRHFFEVLEEHNHPWYYYIKQLGRTCGSFVYIPIIWLIFQLLKRKSYPYMLPLAVWFFLPYTIFSFAATKMAGYVAIASPSVFLIMSAFWVFLFNKTAALQWNITPFKKIGSAFILILLVLVPLKHTLESLRRFSHHERNPAWAAKLRTLQSYIGNKQVVLFNTEHPIESMFYAPYPAYYGFPTANQIKSLTVQDYKILIYNRGNIPDWLLRDPRVKIFKQLDELKDPY